MIESALTSSSPPQNHDLSLLTYISLSLYIDSLYSPSCPTSENKKKETVANETWNARKRAVDAQLTPTVSSCHSFLSPFHCSVYLFSRSPVPYVLRIVPHWRSMMMMKQEREREREGWRSYRRWRRPKRPHPLPAVTSPSLPPASFFLFFSFSPATLLYHPPLLPVLQHLCGARKLLGLAVIGRRRAVTAVRQRRCRRCGR